MRRTTVIVVTALASALVFGIVLTRRLIETWHPERPSASSALTSGEGLTLQFSDKPVPLPALSAIADLDGRPLDLAGSAGRVLVINFWATWCGPCRDELPELVALQEHYRENVTIIGLSIDDGPVADVRSFVREFRVDYPNAVAPPALLKAFGGIDVVPATFVVDSNRRIVTRHVGRIQANRLEHEIRALVGFPTPAKVERVADTGQILIANAAYATTIPGVDLSAHSPSAKQRALKRMNEESCSCGCGLTVAQCRIQDPTCDVSLPQAQKIAAESR